MKPRRQEFPRPEQRHGLDRPESYKSACRQRTLDRPRHEAVRRARNLNCTESLTALTNSYRQPRSRSVVCDDACPIFSSGPPERKHRRAQVRLRSCGAIDVTPASAGLMHHVPNRPGTQPPGDDRAHLGDRSEELPGSDLCFLDPVVHHGHCPVGTGTVRILPRRTAEVFRLEESAQSKTVEPITRESACGASPT